jgi:HAMP domain-containing protein
MEPPSRRAHDVREGVPKVSESRFVVEVVGSPNEAESVTVARVQEALGLDEAKATLLVARMPGVLTRPSAEERAMKVALRLQAAGVAAVHRPLRPEEDPSRVGDPASALPPAPPPPAPAPSAASAAPTREPANGALDPSSAPSVDATHVDVPYDPKLTPMTEAGFGAADIVLPTDMLDDVRSTQERSAEPRRRPTFVEAGATSEPFPEPVPEPDDAITIPEDDDDGDLVRPLTPLPDGVAAGLSAVTPVPGGRAPHAPGSTGRETTPVPTARDVDARQAEPVYRQTRSAGEPSLTMTPPPDEVLKRTGVPASELAAASGRRRGRFGRVLAAQVILPVVLTWGLGATAMWFLLPAHGRTDTFVPLAAATAIAALVGALLAALATAGVARDVVKLRDEARRVAMGELTAPVTTRRDDELGEIAGSLERMRLSLQEGLERLRKRRRGA